MRLLLDNKLSHRLPGLLVVAGHDGVHVRDLGMQHAPDEDVTDLARREDRVLVSADTDFGALLARTYAERRRSANSW